MAGFFEDAWNTATGQSNGNGFLDKYNPIRVGRNFIQNPGQTVKNTLTDIGSVFDPLLNTGDYSASDPGGASNTATVGGKSITRQLRDNQRMAGEYAALLAEGKVDPASMQELALKFYDNSITPDAYSSLIADAKAGKGGFSRNAIDYKQIAMMKDRPGVIQLFNSNQARTAAASGLLTPGSMGNSLVGANGYAGASR